MGDRLQSFKKQAMEEAETIARKEQENAKEELAIQEEEGVRRKLMKKMVTESDKSLSPVTDVLSHFEGISYLKHEGHK